MNITEFTHTLNVNLIINRNPDADTLCALVVVKTFYIMQHNEIAYYNIAVSEMLKVNFVFFLNDTLYC